MGGTMKAEWMRLVEAADRLLEADIPIPEMWGIMYIDNALKFGMANEMYDSREEAVAAIGTQQAEGRRAYPIKVEFDITGKVGG
jgi:hypothetical protein